MNAAERGAYMSMLLYLYQHKGKCPMDLDVIRGICRCGGKFNKIWSKIERKFSISEGVLRHKIVTKKLRELKRLMQVRRAAGLKGSDGRWQTHRQRHGFANDKSVTNTIQYQQVNIGLVKEAQGKEMLELDCMIKEKLKFLTEHLQRTFSPGQRSSKTLSNILAFIVKRIQDRPEEISILTDMVEWANIARTAGRKARGIPLFVAKVKEVTGYGATPKLLKEIKT